MTIGIDTPPRQVIRDAIFAHEMLRRLKIPADDIYFSVDRRAGSLDVIDVSVVVRPSAESWKWPMGSVEATLDLVLEAEALVKEWTEAVNFWNAQSPDIDLWGFSMSRPFAMGTQVAILLHAMGIAPNPIGAGIELLKRETPRQGEN